MHLFELVRNVCLIVKKRTTSKLVDFTSNSLIGEIGFPVGPEKTLKNVFKSSGPQTS